MKSQIFPEQLIPDHVFVYITKGEIHCFDGNKSQILAPNEYYLFRKNHLVKYYSERGIDELGFIRVCFQEKILKKFQDKHQVNTIPFDSADSFLKITENELIPGFIGSLEHIYHQGEIDGTFSDVKQEELLIILLQNQPELAGIFFNYGKPEKINLEEFMNRNYTFNVSLEQFAYLTGRSLSAFKRDFKEIFNESPGRWLIQKRLQEAYFLIEKKKKRPSEIYLDLGFEALSHFSFVFKNQFGLTPTELRKQKKIR